MTAPLRPPAAGPRAVPRGVAALVLSALCLIAGCSRRTPPPAELSLRKAGIRYDTVRPGDAEVYAGTPACLPCHPVQAAFWGTTGHAASMGALTEPAESTDAACLRCHATGYGRRTGYSIADERGLGMVGCEACHGAAGSHARDPLGASPSGGLDRDCPPCIITRICRECHTRRWSPDFEPEGYLSRSRCPQGDPVIKPVEEGKTQ